MSQVVGNVGGLRHWLLSTTIGADSVRFIHSFGQDSLEILAEGSISTGTEINSQPYLIAPIAYRHFPLDIEWLDKVTVFTVLPRSRTSFDRCSWSISARDTNILVHTDRRIGRMDDLSFIDLPSSEPGRVRLSIYYHGHEESPPGPYQFMIAGTADIPDLSLSQQDTLIELLLFDRVLSEFERNKVSSHLAIKYGLTLYGTPFLNADGDKIWNEINNHAHASNVIGVGRDDSSGLLQKQSTSANEPGFIAIGVDTIAVWNHLNPATVPDKHFLLIGDNNAPRQWATREPGQPQYLEREWLVQVTGNDLLSTLVRVDRTWFLNDATSDENHWLVIDRSGTGEFQVGTVDYHQCDVREANAPIAFRDVEWDTDGSGTDVFRVASGGSFIPKLWINAPTCDPPNLGSVHVGVAGGVADIRIQLKQVDGPFEHEMVVQDDSVRTIRNVPQGEFQLELSDASGYRLDDRLWIQAADAPVIPLDDGYILDPGSELVLDAGEHGANTSYEWSIEGEVISTDRELRIERTGGFGCTVNADGCLARKQLTIRTEVEEGRFEVAALPNPAMDGQFRLNIALAGIQEVLVTITNSQGRRIQQRRLQGGDYYSVEFDLDGGGLFLVTVSSSSSAKTLKVIVP